MFRENNNLFYETMVSFERRIIMTEKTYKNKNMIRTKHNVGRFIYFESELERERFIKLYEDLFDRFSRNERGCTLHILLPKKNFDEIIIGAGLINVKNEYKKTKYWRTKGAVV
jgi:hypothetical protein